MARGRRRWDRNQYPENWDEISREFRQSRGYRCEDCGYQQGEPLISRAGKLYRGTVDAAHKFPNDTRNPEPSLICLCKRCHRLYDNGFRELIDEGKHQAELHSIVLEREGWI